MLTDKLLFVIIKHVKLECIVNIYKDTLLNAIFHYECMVRLQISYTKEFKIHTKLLKR